MFFHDLHQEIIRKLSYIVCFKFAITPSFRRNHEDKRRPFCWWFPCLQPLGASKFHVGKTVLISIETKLQIYLSHHPKGQQKLSLHSNWLLLTEEKACKVKEEVDQVARPAYCLLINHWINYSVPLGLFKVKHSVPKYMDLLVLFKSDCNLFS